MPPFIARFSALAACTLLLHACDDGGDVRRHASDVSIDDASGAFEGCSAHEDCEPGTLCVATSDAASSGTCVAACSLEAGDVCPVGERCTAVVDDEGLRHGACMLAPATANRAWRACSASLGCGEGEQCVNLDDALGARCVPSCGQDGTCQNASERCMIQWDGGLGPQSGCAQACRDSRQCEAGARCVQTGGDAGLCVR